MDQQTILYDDHAKYGAKFIDFSGYQLPVWFTNLKDEHFAVREKAGVFDISHMGVLFLDGPDARALLDKVLCSDLDKTKSYKMIYSMVLNEQGGVLDDVMVGPLGEGFILIVNASNKSVILEWLKQFGFNCNIQDMNQSNSFLAVQGPVSEAVLKTVLGDSFPEMRPFECSTASYQDGAITLFRSGYTGEDGFELLIPNDRVSSLYQRLVDKGAQPCGLGARDSLRIEASLPLYGQELSVDLNPLQTRYPWVVSSSADFIGKPVLDNYVLTPDSWVMTGLELASSIARQGYPIVGGGHVSSGTLAPYINKSVALAYLPKQSSFEGNKVIVKVRSREVSATVVKLPFYSRKRKGA